MTATIVTVFFLFALVVVVHGALRAIFRGCSAHKARLSLLEYLENHPETVQNPADVEALVTNVAAADGPGRQNYGVTGALLLAAGGGAMAAGYVMRVGRLAVGLHAGGAICVLIAVFLILLEVFIWYLGRRGRLFTAGASGPVSPEA